MRISDWSSDVCSSDLNLYVNRSMIGAVVGSQPFGGEGLSGTGPKAAGPPYLPRFCVERVTSTDTTSAGGNATLLSLEDEGRRGGGDNRTSRGWGCLLVMPRLQAVLPVLCLAIQTNRQP